MLCVRFQVSSSDTFLSECSVLAIVQQQLLGDVPQSIVMRPMAFGIAGISVDHFS